MLGFSKQDDWLVSVNAQGMETHNFFSKFPIRALTSGCLPDGVARIFFLPPYAEAPGSEPTSHQSVELHRPGTF